MHALDSHYQQFAVFNQDKATICLDLPLHVLICVARGSYWSPIRRKAYLNESCMSHATTLTGYLRVHLIVPVVLDLPILARMPVDHSS